MNALAVSNTTQSKLRTSAETSGRIVATDVRAPGYEAEREAGGEMLITLDPRAASHAVRGREL